MRNSGEEKDRVSTYNLSQCFGDKNKWAENRQLSGKQKTDNPHEPTHKTTLGEQENDQPVGKHNMDNPQECRDKSGGPRAACHAGCPRTTESGRQKRERRERGGGRGPRATCRECVQRP